MGDGYIFNRDFKLEYVLKITIKDKHIFALKYDRQTVGLCFILC